MPEKTLLADYRRRVAEQYARYRREPDHETAVVAFRKERNDFLRTHPLSALTDAQRAHRAGLPYFDYDAAWRIGCTVDSDVSEAIIEGELPEGPFRYQRVGKVHFQTPTGHDGTLTLFWILGYGGGLFLPFRDATNSNTSYGGGRYLYDTIKGADLGASKNHILLDFNMAFHPSCAYNPAWVCPLAPSENHLAFPVPAGEMLLKREQV